MNSISPFATSRAIPTTSRTLCPAFIVMNPQVCCKPCLYRRGPACFGRGQYSSSPSSPSVSQLPPARTGSRRRGRRSAPAAPRSASPAPAVSEPPFSSTDSSGSVDALLEDDTAVNDIPLDPSVPPADSVLSSAPPSLAHSEGGEAVLSSTPSLPHGSGALPRSLLPDFSGLDLVDLVFKLILVLSSLLVPMLLLCFAFPTS